MPSCYDSYACLFGKMRKRHEHRTMTVYHRRSTVSDLVISPSDQDEVCLGIRTSFPCRSTTTPTTHGTSIYVNQV
jgi:hypothetical protein